MEIKLQEESGFVTGFKSSGPIQRGDMTYGTHIELKSIREGKALDPLPRRFSREKQKLRSQDKVGACVAFSATNALEADLVTFGDKTQLSPAFIYALCQEMDGYQTAGTTFTTLREVLMKYGVCEEKYYPFDVKDRKLMDDLKNLKFPRISSNAKSDAKKRRIKDMYRINLTIQDVKRAVYEENSVLLGMTVTTTYKEDQNGCIGNMGGFILGGHAVDVCSWDDDIELTYDYRKVHGPESEVVTYKGAFRFENHWVEKEDADYNPLIWWGDDGYGWIPYEVFGNKADIGFQLIDEAWVIIANNGDKVIDEKYHDKVSEDQFDTREISPIKNTINISFEVGSDEAVVNGKKVVMDCNTKLINGRSMVPIRFISEVFGAKVNYYGSTKTATLEIKTNLRNIFVELQVGSSMARINSDGVTMDVETILDSGRVLVPIRFISEAFGAKVGYTGSTNTATIQLTPQGFIEAMDRWN